MHPSYPLKTGFEHDIVRSRHIHCYAINNPFTVKWTKRSMNRRVRRQNKIKLILHEKETCEN